MRANRFPAGSVRAAVAALGDCWRLECDAAFLPAAVSSTVRDAEAMRHAEHLRNLRTDPWSPRRRVACNLVPLGQPAARNAGTLLREGEGAS